MFCVSFGAIGGRKNKVILILSALLFTALLAVIISLCCQPDRSFDSGYTFDLKETGGAGGFLSQFSLTYERQESMRHITLPERDDEVFCEYAELQSKIGLNVLKFSTKRVEERYLKLKEKSQKGENFYAVIYIYKDKIVAAHLTTLEQESELLPITAFV